MLSALPSPLPPSLRYTVEVGKLHLELVLTLIKLLDVSGPRFFDLENEDAGLGDF